MTQCERILRKMYAVRNSSPKARRRLNKAARRAAKAELNAERCA